MSKRLLVLQNDLTATQVALRDALEHGHDTSVLRQRIETLRQQIHGEEVRQDEVAAKLQARRFQRLADTKAAFIAAAKATIEKSTQDYQQ